MLRIEKTNIELAEGYSRTIPSMYLRRGDSSIIIYNYDNGVIYINCEYVGNQVIDHHSARIII